MADWWVLAIGLFIVVAAVVLFNGLVTARNRVRAAWSDIDVQLTRRHDLVPQLVAAVQGYASHERATLEAVTALRQQALQAVALDDKARIEAALAQQVNRLLALQENYPELKASANFLQLQRELVEVEDHLQYARRFYNGAVRDYNDATQRFPALLVARGFGFAAAEFFQAESDSRAAPHVELAP